MSDPESSEKEYPSSPERKSARYTLVALSAFLVGFIFSLVIWDTSRQAVHKTETTRFNHYAAVINSMIDDQLDDQVSAARSLQAFFNASNKVTRKEWRQFVHDLKMERHYFGALGFAFTRYVKSSELESFIASTRKDGAPDFEVKTTDEHPDHYIVELIDPLETNREMFGYDYATEPVRRIAFINAVEHNQVALSGRISLMQSKKANGFLLVLPVYEQGARTDTITQRWQALEGWVTVPIRIDDLLADVFENLENPVDIEIFDGSPDANDYLLYDHDGELHTLPRQRGEDVSKHSLLSKTSLKFANHEWFLNIIALPELTQTFEHYMPGTLLFAGLLLSFLAAWLIWFYGHHLDEEKVLTRQITSELRRTEQSFQNMFQNHHSAMLLVSAKDGTILDANHAASRFYGYPPEELIDMSITKINGMPNEQTLEAIQRIITGEQKHFEFQHHLASGEIRDVEVHSSPIEINQQTVLFSIIHDITPRKQIESALRESEERFRAAFATNPDPVILTSYHEGTILDANQSFTAVTGTPVENATGQCFGNLGFWEDRKQFSAFLTQLHRDKAVNNVEINFFNKGRKKRIGVLSARHILVKERDCALILMRDITLEKTAERTLLELNQMKSEFISTAAHELRTPLSAIMGYTEILLSPRTFGKFTLAQKKNFLKEVYDRGKALSRLIDDLLDISRVESGSSLNLQRQETHVQSLIEHTLEYFRIHDKCRSYQLEVSGDELHAPILIDNQRITQVLENLIGNASKFSPECSEILVTAHSGQKFWEIKVIDQGIGMTEEQLEKVFDKFYRVDASNTGRSGLGLGMSIVRQIIESHGGTIDIESTPGTGTSVTFTLPKQP